MEHFAQTNVFARIRTIFSWIRTVFSLFRTVFAHLIIGCAIRYPKIGCLRYILYYYTLNNDYTWYYICSAWFLDIIISTCLNQGFIMLYTEDFTMRHYVGFSQIRSHICKVYTYLLLYV